MIRWLPFLMSAGLVGMSGCGRSPDPRASGVALTATSTNQRVYQAKGVVIAVKPREKSVEIKHEEIPNFMPAMTMPFDVKDTNELAGLSPGDTVSFRMIVTDIAGWIDQI